MLSLVLAAALASQSPELRLELVRESLTGTHCRYREYVDGIPNEAYVTLPCGWTTLSAPLPAPAPRLLRDRAGRVFRRAIDETTPFQPYAED
ncbi:MAG TPA: hypothetical protein VHL59_00755, partial [Thermoanaerobaculia bacterium]|nr:hypothetical protein [Thermoanaerobaculia bacterium]